jgi:hypothetical protein
MSASASAYAAFYKEAHQSGAVWTVRDADGFPAPETASGSRAMPFWSKRSRVERVISNVQAYSTFEAVEIPLDEFRDRWLPGLEKDALLVGINWSGKRATGYDVSPHAVQKSLAGTSS